MHVNGWTMIFRKGIYFIMLCCVVYCKPADRTETNKEKKAVVGSVVAADTSKKILFFGNSLTAAYGIDPKDGFVALLQQRLLSENLNYRTINAGLSGETTAGGLERVDWILKQHIDIFVLELGGNDALRGISPTSSYQNLKGIIEKVKARYPDVKIVLAGMQAPPNMGKEYTKAFSSNYLRLAQEYHLALIPFLLEDVGGVKELNLKDGIHPNEEGQKIVLENVWKTLKTIL